MVLQQESSFIEEIFWRSLGVKGHAAIKILLLTTLFLSGIIYWIAFYNKGQLSLSAPDWLKEDAYLNTLRRAQINGVIPWEWNEPFYHDTTKFIANPEILLTPDILLLRWTTNSVFIIIHTLLLYAAGFWGSYLLMRKLRVSFVSFCFFWLLFNFNGHIISNLVIGHFQWTGYFLLPAFFLLLLNLIESDQGSGSLNTNHALGISLLFAIWFLNGSIHTVILCSIFLVVVALFQRSMLLNNAVAIGAGFLLGTFRLLPAALWFPPKPGTGQGFPTFGTLLDAFTALRLYDFMGLNEFGVFRWWEYSFYIGFTAFIVLLLSGFVVLQKKLIPLQPSLLQAGAVLTLLSFGNIYNIVNVLPIPLIGIERVPSRLFVIPFILFLLVSVKGFDEIMAAGGRSARSAGTIAVLFTCLELFFHYQFWNMESIEYLLPIVDKPVRTLVTCSDQWYISVTYASWMVSLSVFVFIMVSLIREAFKRTDARTIPADISN